MIEFDLGEGNQLYFDPEKPEEAAKDAEPVPKYTLDATENKAPSSKVQQIAQGPRINVVLPERRVSASKQEMSEEQLAEDLERTLREKINLEGQLEVSRGCTSLLLPRLPKLPNQCYSNRAGDLGNLSSNNNMQSEITHFTHA